MNHIKKSSNTVSVPQKTTGRIWTDMHLFALSITVISMISLWIMSVRTKDVIMSELYLSLAIVGSALTFRILSTHK